MGDDKPTKAVPTQGDTLDEMDPSTGKHKDYIINDFQIDLPYDHSYLVENLIDPAHIPISHDATSGGGKRENAQESPRLYCFIYAYVMFDMESTPYTNNRYYHLSSYHHKSWIAHLPGI